MADKKIGAEKKAVEESGGGAQDLRVESTKLGNRVNLRIGLDDLRLNFNLPADSFAVRYLEEHGIINP